MTISNEAALRYQVKWDAAIKEAQKDSPEGFEFIGFLWGYDYTHGPFLAPANGRPATIGRAVYARIEE